MNFEFNALQVLALGVVAVGLVFAYISAQRHHNRMQTHGVRVEGIVVRNKIKWGSNTTVRPIIRFVTQDGRTIEAESTYGVAFALPRYPKGATVTVIYNQDNPFGFDITDASRRYI